MVKRFLLSGIILLAAAGALRAQQVPDLNYNPPVPRPAYKSGKGPRVAIDEAAMFSAQLAGPQKMPMGMNSPDATQNYQLLLNVIHWLTRAKGMPG